MKKINELFTAGMKKPPFLLWLLCPCLPRLLMPLIVMCLPPSQRLSLRGRPTMEL
ncbi:hypothetical protein [Aeromonas salmonicida]|uniref:hypothetical protein n=1 Tax=Aeromonas salmonicida TaxID=645 RepID=UPI0015587622|nr:hypothetical protein [Aeromonas salmonicida]